MILTMWSRPDDRGAVEDLLDRVRELELEAAHHCEYIDDGAPSSAVTAHALDAAVCFGWAGGLREAIDVLAEPEVGPS
jgi:hypothetical protein